MECHFHFFEKGDVNGANEQPIYRHLKQKVPGAFGTSSIKWNFTKFLVGRDGEVIKRYAPFTKPKDIEKDIMRALIDSNSLPAFRSKIEPIKKR